MPEYVLGIDFGEKRIGLAVGQTMTCQAQALTTLINDGSFWQQLQNIINEWHISSLVFGLPLDASGQEQEITRRVKNFARKASQNTALSVTFVDERYTSYEAERTFQQSRAAGLTKAKQKSQLDAMAAQIILQSWFDQQHNT
ncbi:Holliday junction resolvase RuvX [Marinicella sediminis]|uniref:Putative pre-16S rRNA nuclease n=1 Tax=Marinicella sediminis TaxID=1792834 RepID=A0ABV7J8D0_9GAMM|nr:Holliday junction resolvase RuvX [Marinicella sediminis]